MTGAQSDEQLMLEYRGGDAKAFEHLYRRHKGPSYRYFLRQGVETGLAEELYQELWMAVIRARERYQASAKFTTWLYQIAHNLLVDHYRRQSRRPQLSAETHTAADERSPERQVGAADQLAQVRTLIAALPDVQREAFLLKQEAGLSLAQIAQITGVGEETTKSRLRYAYDRIKALLGRDR